MNRIEEIMGQMVQDLESFITIEGIPKCALIVRFFYSIKELTDELEKKEEAHKKEIKELEEIINALKKDLARANNKE